MQKHTKLTVLATLGTVALGATLIGAVPALAAGNGSGYGRGSLQAELSQTADVVPRGCANYTDVDGDGICDSCGGGNGAGFADADGDGICDHRESGTGNGAGYVDADGDGICDNYGTSAGNGAGRGDGSGYVDTDGDGICDNYGTGAGGGHHGHHGGGHHGSGRGRC